MKTTTKIFVVEDDHFFGSMVTQMFQNKKFNKVQLFKTGEGFLNHLNENPDIVILDHNLGSMNGIDILRKIKSFNPKIEVIFLSAQEKLATAIQSLKYGAYDYLEKNDANLQRLLMLVNRISISNNLVKENKELKRSRYRVLAVYVSAVITIIALYFVFPNVFQ